MTNVFVGHRGGDKISGEWADIPLSSFKGSGDLVLTCARIDGIDTLRQFHQTGGFSGTVFFNNHIKFESKIVRGDCEATPVIILVHDGRAQWRADAFSHSRDLFGFDGGGTGDVFVVNAIHLEDQAGNILFTFPKFVSKELQNSSPRIGWVVDLSFPSNIFKSIRGAQISSSC